MPRAIGCYENMPIDEQIYCENASIFREMICANWKPLQMEINGVFQVIEF